MYSILVASDSFKNALPANKACQAIERGLKRASDNFLVTICPLSDGGEGASEVVQYHQPDYRPVEMTVLNPLLNPVEAQFVYNPVTEVAFIEMARASGLERLHTSERNPNICSSYGTGQFIVRALDKGAKAIKLSLGGSATHDGGTGMALALGFRFLDAHNRPIEELPARLLEVSRIDNSAVHPRLYEVAIYLLCDVNNPLTGADGAACVYAPQKGASKGDLPLLEKKMQHLNDLFKYTFKKDLSDIPGTGAAGGMGAGGIAFLNGQIQSGATYFLQLAGLEEKINHTHLIISGEGNLDSQTKSGKLLHAILQLAKQSETPVLGLCGQLDRDAALEVGFKAAFSINSKLTSLKEALPRTAINLEQTAHQVGRLIASFV